MRYLLSNIYLLVALACFACIGSLVLSLHLSDPEWFQASGALVTVAGVLLAARKLVRLGLKDFIRSEKDIDYGSIQPTPAEVEHNRQFELDIKSYRWSIRLLIVGTFIWAYGGLIMRSVGIYTSA